MHRDTDPGQTGPRQARRPGEPLLGEPARQRGRKIARTPLMARLVVRPREVTTGAEITIVQPGLGTGHVMRSTRLTNRGGAKSVPQAVWDKVSGDGTVLGEIGPANLMQSLEPVWPEGQEHLPIEAIRDWLDSYVYLPRLRDETTFNNALLRLVEDLASDYVFATTFNEETQTYEGVIDGKPDKRTPGSVGILPPRGSDRLKPPPGPRGPYSKRED